MACGYWPAPTPCHRGTAACIAAQAGVPVIKLHEGGRHTGNSLMRDAGVDQEVRVRTFCVRRALKVGPLHGHKERIRGISAAQTRWGGWGSNPRPADYEKYGPLHRTHYLHI